MKLAAKIISIFSSPPLIAIPFAYAVVYKSSLNGSYSLYWTFVSSLFVLVVCLFVLYGVRTGMYTNFDISKREQRSSIYGVAAVLTALYMIAVFIFSGPHVLLYSLFGLLVGVGIASIINTKIKASVHMAVFAAFSLVLGLLYGGPFWFVFIFLPLVGWSRIVLKRHEPPETVVGTALGIFVVLLLYFVVSLIYG